MADETFIKGFRTNCAYYPESTFGTYNIGNTASRKYKRIGGKLKGVNWTARQNIIKTGSVGGGRNYVQQIYGNYDASASVSFEVVDFDFLRFGVGDVAKSGTGTTEGAPYFLVESELVGVDGDGTSKGALDSSTNGFTKVRIRPFSMLLYDAENVASSSTYNESVDMLSGCIINDISLTSSVNTPLMCTANMLVKQISFKRNIPSTDIPNWTLNTGADTTDYGHADDQTPYTSQTIADDPPLMFFNGSMKSYTAAGDTGATLGQVTSFTYSWSNSMITYRGIGSRFIQMPQCGMRRLSLRANVVFRLPVGTVDGALDSTATETNMLDLIRNYLGYSTTYTFSTGTELLPALSSGGPSSNVPQEKYQISLVFTNERLSGETRGATINAHYCTVDGFGVPLTLENGLIEIPITFSVRGYPYVRVSDGSYSGHDGAGTAMTDYHPTFTWWI